MFCFFLTSLKVWGSIKHGVNCFVIISIPGYSVLANSLTCFAQAVLTLPFLIHSVFSLCCSKYQQFSHGDTYQKDINQTSYPNCRELSIWDYVACQIMARRQVELRLPKKCIENV